MIAFSTSNSLRALVAAYQDERKQRPGADNRRPIFARGSPIRRRSGRRAVPRTP